jgi:hypothetical protein
MTTQGDTWDNPTQSVSSAPAEDDSFMFPYM